jgi:hypothetical protein
MSTLSVELRAGQSLRIGEAMVRLEFKTGKTARLSVSAPTSVPIVLDAPPMSDLLEMRIGSSNFHQSCNNSNR